MSSVLFYLNTDINVAVNVRGIWIPMMCDIWCMGISRGHL